MTREEAIEQLKHDRDLCNFNPMTGEEDPMNEDCRKSAEALDMAIKALEQEPSEDTMIRTCSNCAYYDNGANDEACDGCFADEYEHPNFKPKSEPILDKIRAEIESDWQLKKYPSSPFSCGLRQAIEIIDKYKAESEDYESL